MNRWAILFISVAGMVVVGTTAYFHIPWSKLDANATVTLAVGILAAALAVWALFSQRAITRRQVTLEHIAMLETDGDLIRGRVKFKELVRSPEGLIGWAAVDKEDTAEFQVIVNRLNEFELIAIGIQRGIIDYELYSRWFKSGTVRTWSDAEPFIIELRRRLKNNMLFHEFGEMVRWFEQNAPPKRSRLWGNLF